MIDVILMCLAWNVYFEARGEPLAGQFGVAEVTITRAFNSGRNVCEEVFLDRQFSWNNGDVRPKIHNPYAWDMALFVAGASLEQRTSFTQGATHYHNGTVSPKWAKKLCQTVRIGKHVFYKKCPSGEIGKHSGLKIRRLSLRGSSPLLGTNVQPLYKENDECLKQLF